MCTNFQLRCYEYLLISNAAHCCTGTFAFWWKCSCNLQLQLPQ
jgi:hypothetical protein